MKHDHRLWRVLHVLIHMHQHAEPMTSKAIAHMLSTNPVVVRRTMAGLREQGYVISEKGPGGGWQLGRPIQDITLLDVYQALGSPAIFALGPATDHKGCLVEIAVNAALDESLKQAEALLLGRFAQVTVAEIEQDFQDRWDASDCKDKQPSFLKIDPPR